VEQIKRDPDYDKTICDEHVANIVKKIHVYRISDTEGMIDISIRRMPRIRRERLRIREELVRQTQHHNESNIRTKDNFAASFNDERAQIISGYHHSSVGNFPYECREMTYRCESFLIWGNR
jgi:hypothetical protein